MVVVTVAVAGVRFGGGSRGGGGGVRGGCDSDRQRRLTMKPSLEP